MCDVFSNRVVGEVLAEFGGLCEGTWTLLDREHELPCFVCYTQANHSVESTNASNSPRALLFPRFAFHALKGKSSCPNLKELQTKSWLAPPAFLVLQFRRSQCRKHIGILVQSDQSSFPCFLSYTLASRSVGNIKPSSHCCSTFVFLACSMLAIHRDLGSLGSVFAPFSTSFTLASCFILIHVVGCFLHEAPCGIVCFMCTWPL